MIYTLGILLLLFQGFFSSANEEHLKLIVIRNGKEVGYTTATKSNFSDQVKYISHTLTKVNVLKEIDVLFTSEVYMEDGVLSSSEVQVSVNGRMHTTTRTLRNGSSYQVIQDGKSKDQIADDITYTSVMLLFEEPHLTDYSYSEKTGEMHSIRQLAPHSYEKEDGKGRISQYYYENGELVKARVDSGFFKFELIR